MRNIFLFIRKYITFLLFVVLQIIALSFLFRYNKFHEAAFLGISNEVTGSFSKQYDRVEYYFTLKRTNQTLVAEIERLRNQLPANFEVADTSTIKLVDTLSLDTSGQARKYYWRTAKVVRNSVSMQNNYLTIHRGFKQGVLKDMGVVSAGGVVGTVVSASDNYAVVMSVLNRQSRISSKLKNSGDYGSVLWDGEDPRFLTMINIPKSVKVKAGDSVVTSQYSYLFPEGILVGRVAEISSSAGSNFYTLKLQTGNNFYNVEFVSVVENIQKDEQKKLEEATRNNQ